MSLLLLAAFAASQPGISSPPKALFTAGDMVSLREQTLEQCGYASPQDLMSLPQGER